MNDAHPALRELHSHARGVLLSDGVPSPRGYVLDRRTGLPIMMIDHTQARAEESVLFIPDESAPRLQLLVEVDPFTRVLPGARDRWQAYHLSLEGPLWSCFRVVSARHGSDIIDGETLALPSPLADSEPALCALANAGSASLARAARVDPGQAVCVGVDPFGLHVRTHLGVHRLAFPTPAFDEHEARARIGAILPADAGLD